MFIKLVKVQCEQITLFFRQLRYLFSRCAAQQRIDCLNETIELRPELLCFLIENDELVQSFLNHNQTEQGIVDYCCLHLVQFLRHFADVVALTRQKEVLCNHIV